MSFSQNTMMRATSRQRRERIFEWNRLRSAARVHTDLIFQEEVDPDIFKNIMTKHKNTWNAETVLRMEEIQVSMENVAWSRRLVPHQKEMAELPSGYQGCRKVGRSYGFLFANVPSKIVNTLYRDTHRYIDANCCFPTILLNVGSHLDVEALQSFVTNRDEIFSLFWMEHRLNASTIKSAINSMIGACPRLPATFGLGPGRDDDIRILSEHPFILKLQSEFVDIANDIFMEYPEYYEGIRNRCLQRKEENHIHGVALSFFCQDVEDACMRTVVEHLRASEDDALAKNMLWKFDGIFVPKSMTYPIGADGQAGPADDDTFLQGVQQAVYDAHKIHLKFSFKDISSEGVAYQDCGVDSSPSSYQRWKKGFDMKYVKFRNPPRYGRLLEDGTYQLLSYGANGSGGDFGFQNKEEPQEFVDQWVKDPCKTIYKGMCFAPPPRIAQDGFLNTYRGFAVHRLGFDLSKEEIKRLAQPFLVHLDHMASSDEKTVVFLHKYFAHLFQKPGVKSEKIIFIRSIQGTGKDQMFNFLSMILGQSLTHKAANVAEIKGLKSANLENRIVLCFSECNHTDFKDNEYLKNLANRTHFTVSQKYIPEYLAPCYVNIFMYSNQFYGMGMDMDNRRFVAMEANPRIANLPEYHEPFAAYIRDPLHQYAVYRYFHDMDIGDFFPGNCDTKTRIMKQMASQSFNYAAWFLNDNFENWVQWSSPTGNDYRRVSDHILKVSCMAFFGALKEFAEKMKIADKDTTQKLNSWSMALFTEAGNKMTKYCPEGITPYSSNAPSDAFRVGNGKKMKCKTFYIPAVQQFVNETCIDENKDDQEDDNAGELRMT